MSESFLIKLHAQASIFIEKETLAQVSFEKPVEKPANFAKFLRNFFYRTPQVAASGSVW